MFTQLQDYLNRVKLQRHFKSVLMFSDWFISGSSSPQVKFNQALADHSMSEKPRLIDGIVLTKFDTIDDKVNPVQCVRRVLRS